MIKNTRAYFDDCTIGRLQVEDLNFFTLELPDLDNQVNISCIPEGIYTGRIIISPSLGQFIDILDVKGRTFIRMHAGNFTSQILGCVLVGDGLKYLNDDNIPDITNSKKSLNKIMCRMGLNKFEIEIC